MGKITGVLSALLGAGLAASITLNVCCYRKFNEEKQNRLKRAAVAGRVDKRTKVKTIIRQKKEVSRSVEPLFLERSGISNSNTIFAQFSNDVMNQSELTAKHISIEPALPFEVVEPSYDNDCHIRIKAAFQPETTYRVVIRKGLVSRQGGKLEYDASFEVRFPALKTELNTLSTGLIFPAGRANRTLPLEICNLDEIRVSVLRLYENNLQRFSAMPSWDGEIKALEYGRQIARKSVPVKIPRNRKINYALDLTRLLPQGKTGVYGLQLTAMEKGKYRCSAQLALTVTDLAEQCVVDHVNKKAFAAVRKLSDGTPCAGAEVMLFSGKYQVLAKGKTDAAGLVRLDYGSSQAGSDPQDYPNALLVKLGSDLVFQQELFYSGHSLAEFESGNGNPVQEEPRALVYTERGVYRPGENVFATFWVRKSDLKEYASAPCLVKILDPSDNVIYSRKEKTSPGGWIHTSFRLPEDIPGGNYTVRCLSPDEDSIWGSASFLAADFMPDRIKVSLKGHAAVLMGSKQQTDFTFGAEYYFGGKLDKSPYQFTVTPLPAAPRPEWGDWTVGCKDFSAGRKFTRSGKISGEDIKIGYPGFAVLEGRAYRPVALNAAARVSEPGGRAVTANTTLIYHPTAFYLGLQQESVKDRSVLKWKFLPAEKDVKETLKDQPIKITLNRYDWKYVLKKNGRKLAREWIREKVPVCTETVRSGEQPQGVWSRKLASGSYEVTAESGSMRTVMEFWHWYGEGSIRSANPAVLSCTTDKAKYQPGDTAQITFRSTAAGFAVVALGDRELLSYAQYPVVKGSNTISVKLPADAQSSECFAGITMVSGEQRQFGLVRLALEQKRHQLKIVLDAPQAAMPKEKVKVKIALQTPAGQAQNGTVQLFAVDEGILALTSYAVPDIFAFFFGRYNCSFIFTDIYSMIYPDLKIDRSGKIGGDGAGSKADANRLANARKAVRQSAVIVLPPVTVNGSREFELTLPDHLGTMRLMAVASTPDRAGSAQKTLKMRDKLDILPTLPQTAAPKDETELTFALFNHELQDGKAVFELTLPSGRKITAEPMLKRGRQTVFKTRVTLPEKEGLFTLTATLKKDGIVKRREMKLPVRLPNPSVTFSVVKTLKPGEKWTSPANAGFAADAEYSLSVSGSCTAVLKTAVDWLNRYPYGCLEQTVSGAFPFLSAGSLEQCGVITKEMARTAKVKANLAAAKILSMMLYNGAFPMWQGGTAEWAAGTVYAAHFLAAGENLRDHKQKMLLAGYLKILMQNASKSRYERAYAGYVLALMGLNRQEVLSGMRNILASREEDYPAFLAAAALQESGYSGEAWPRIRKLLKQEIWRMDKSAPHFSGEAARAGMTLYILMKQRTDAPETVALLRQTLLRQVKPDGSGWGITHANAWAVLGLAELERTAAGAKGAVSVALPGKAGERFDPARGRTFKLKSAETVTVENTGKTPVYVNWRVKGIPLKPQKVSQVLSLKRTILRNGKAVGAVKQGDLVTVRLQLNTTGTVRDMVLSDMLPGGLEIEDERFATRAKGVSAAAQAPKNLTVKQEEKRPGEFVLSGDLYGNAEITYQARAVSRGRFAMGAASAEAMYDPQTRAVEPGTGWFEVK